MSANQDEPVLPSDVDREEFEDAQEEVLRRLRQREVL